MKQLLTPQTPTTLSVGKFSKVLEQERPGPKSQQNQGHAGEFQAAQLPNPLR